MIIRAAVTRSDLKNIAKNRLQFLAMPTSTTTDAMGLKFLNQARASLRPAHAWFLKIDPVRIVSMRVRVCACVCVSAPEAINN